MTAIALSLHILRCRRLGRRHVRGLYLPISGRGWARDAARLRLWRGFFQKFFPWVWLSILLLLASGYWMVFTTFGGFAKLPLHVNLMQGIGWLMILLYLWLFHGPWLALKRAVQAENWTAAGVNLTRIRQIIAINLPLGLIVAIIGASGRYWG